MAINTLYLDNGILNSAKKTFIKQNPNNIRLENFFQKPVFLLLQKKLNSSTYSLKFHPYKHKYFTTKSKEIDSFLKGRYFSELVKKILGFKKFRIGYEIRKFVPGSYTLLHDAGKDTQGVDFVLDFSKSDGNFGGNTIYLTESEELLTVHLVPNSLSFIERKGGLMKYTKYVTHQNTNPIIQVFGAIIRK